MEINLRKAHALQSAIHELLQSITTEMYIEVNEFENPEHSIINAKSKFLTGFGRKIALYNALYDIRKAIGVANSTSKIDMVLSNINHLDKIIDMHEEVRSAKPRISDAVIEGVIKKQANATPLYGGTIPAIKTSIFTDADINLAGSSVLKLKKERMVFTDSLLDENVKTTINISGSTYDTLVEESLV